ncbi:MAG: GAF domain-containing protein [Acidobacteriota bacterium]|nr:GAF domain-containing protein [Acidobacteriota bacterium]
MSSPARPSPGARFGRGADGSISRTAIAVIIITGALLQAALWLAFERGTISASLFAPALVLVSWAVLIVPCLAVSRHLTQLRRDITHRDDQHRATLDQVEQLEAHNEMLQTLARSTDVTLAFQALARRVARIVPCDRVGLALLKEGGQEFHTFTARVTEPERRTRPRIDLEFNLDRTHIGQVVRSCEALIVDSFADQAADFLDANVLHQTGFQSGMVLPLLSKNRAVGTLNVVSRAPAAFTAAHRDALEPIAEILAVAYVAQQLQQSLARFRTMEAMAELTLSIASEIQSALQTIIGHCDLLERGYPDTALQRDVAVITRQAQRIQDLLERMRTAAQDRLREIAEQVQTGVPSSPEAFSEDATRRS